MTISKTTTQDCGCGGARGGACGCRSAICSTEGIGAAETYVRPNFFAGQLLTEDDLDRLVQYTTDKLRLRNRHLFGSGVVCGLEVGCHPCVGSLIIVHPGHAIDCCGNDIVVPCPEQLDVNAMLRELRTELRGGWDCGDPCDRQEAPTDPNNNNNNNNEVVSDDAGAKPVERGRSYSLWAVYDEQSFDLQTPYETDDPCSSLSCEPTRIRESYRFELRCPEDPAKPVDLFTRVWGCIQQFVSSKQDVQVGRALQVKAVHADTVQTAIAVDPDHHWEISSAAQYTEELSSLAQIVHGHIEAGGKIDKPHTIMRDLERLAGLRLRFELHDDDQKKALLDANLQLAFALPISASRVVEGASTFGPQWQQANFEVDIDRRQARAVTDVIAKWYRPPGPNEDEVQFESYEVLRDSYEAVLLSEQLAYTTTLHDQHVQALAELRGALRQVLDRRRVITDCALAGDLANLQLPSTAGGAEITDLELASYVTAAYALAELILRWLRECICGALQPSCPSCDQDGVLLARLRVDDCEVIEICNLARRWVLTAANIRYWLPPLRLLGDLLEKACCALPLELTFDRTQDKRRRARRGKKKANGAAYYYVDMPKAATANWLLPLVEQPFSKTPMPDMLLNEVGRTWANQPIKWSDFSEVADELGQMVVSRTSKEIDLDFDLGKRGASKQAMDLAEALASAPAKRELESVVDKVVNDAAEAGRIDLGPSLRRAAADNLELMRSERDAALRRNLEDFAEAEEGGLREAVASIFDERVELATGDLRKRVESEVTRKIRDSGLDARGRELWLNAALDARLAELNLQPEAIRNRTERLTEKLLADNNLIGELLDRRLRDEVDARIASHGLDPAGLDAKLDAKLRAELAETGVDELEARVSSSVRKALAEEALLGESLDARLGGVVERRLAELPSGGVSAEDGAEIHAAIERSNTHIRSLRSQIAALKKKVEELTDG